MSREFDPDVHRNEHESEIEWNLKRMFLVAHHGNFELPRLLCLASCFVNVEMYNCTYPDQVMRQLAALTDDFMDELRNHRETVRKRVLKKFEEKPKKKRKKKEVVNNSSSDNDSDQDLKDDLTSDSEDNSADENNDCKLDSNTSRKSVIQILFSKLRPRVLKHQKSPQKYKNSKLIKILLNRLEENLPKFDYARRNDNSYKCQLILKEQRISFGIATKKSKARDLAYQDLIRKILKDNKPREKKPKQEIEIVPCDDTFACPTDSGLEKKIKLHNIVIIINNRLIGESKKYHSVILQETLSFNHVSLDWEFRKEDEGHRVTLFVEGCKMADCFRPNSVEAKQDAARICLNYLNRFCWTVVHKDELFNARTVDRDTLLKEVDGETNLQSSFGRKMLSNMGWKPGMGLGKNGQGILDPISTYEVTNREGLGLSTVTGLKVLFKERLSYLLKLYVKDKEEDPLKFSASFMKAEREFIHSQARRLGLKSTSRGSGTNRYLTVYHKRKPSQLLKYVQSLDRDNEKYQLIPPRDTDPNKA